MNQIDNRLSAMEIDLPPAPKPVASYVPWVRSGNLLFISGQIPLVEGKLGKTGSVPGDISVKEAQEMAYRCVLNGLAVVKAALDGDLDRVQQIVRIGVYVASQPGFTDQPLVANGASDLLVEIFGEAGRHARAAVGAIALPLGAPVEVEMVVEVRE